MGVLLSSSAVAVDLGGGFEPGVVVPYPTDRAGAYSAVCVRARAAGGRWMDRWVNHFRNEVPHHHTGVMLCNARRVWRDRPTEGALCSAMRAVWARRTVPSPRRERVVDQSIQCSAKKG